MPTWAPSPGVSPPSGPSSPRDFGYVEAGDGSTSPLDLSPVNSLRGAAAIPRPKTPPSQRPRTPPSCTPSRVEEHYDKIAPLADDAQRDRSRAEGRGRGHSSFRLRSRFLGMLGIPGHEGLGVGHHAFSSHSAALDSSSMRQQQHATAAACDSSSSIRQQSL